MKVYLRFFVIIIAKIIKKESVIIEMKKNFIAIIKNILKNKNIPKYCFEIIEKKMEVLVFFRQITLM